MADCLRGRGFIARVWDERLFRQGESTFDGLLRITREEVEFGVFVWGASDVLINANQPVAAPRDNVVFETGLFLGALGKDRTFMVVDQEIEIKIPTDFNGITRAYYDGSLLGRYDLTAVSSACNVIEWSIRDRQVPDPLQRLQGRWISLFAAGPFPNHPVETDNVEIRAEGNGIALTGRSGEIPYTGNGRVYYKGQVIGEWTHPSNRSPAEGLFMLVPNATGDAMYGYSTTQDARGATVFATWVFAKANYQNKSTVKASLFQAQKDLQECTISPRLELDKILLPDSDQI